MARSCLVFFLCLPDIFRFSILDFRLVGQSEIENPKSEMAWSITPDRKCDPRGYRGPSAPAFRRLARALPPACGAPCGDARRLWSGIRMRDGASAAPRRAAPG